MGWLKFCIEWLCEAEGIFFLICTITTVMVAVLTRPGKYVRNFKILAILLLVSISWFEYHDRAHPDLFRCYGEIIPHLQEYFSALLPYLLFGISYGLIFSLFYWGIVILMKVISTRVSISKVIKSLIIIVSSIVIWCLADIWYNIGGFLVFILVLIIER
ncbi:MAG: hypothetical protein IKK33_03055 [Lachnospiraceae bacterium]|nr:hypothetical protein [Lachnospiraceae bacterium]